MSERDPIAFDARWMGRHGIGRFATELSARIACTPLLEHGRPLDLIDPWRVSRALRRTAPRLYLTPGFNPPARTSVPFIMTVHDLIHLDVPEERSVAKRVYYERLVRPALRRAAAVLTVSEHARRRIVEWSGIDSGAVHVVGNGVAAAFTPEGSVHQEPGHAPYCFWIGNPKAHKNLPRTIAAFLAADVDPAMRLVICGATRADLRDDPGPRVTFVTAPDDAELAALYRGASMTLIVSLVEGFGLPAIESMACGTPVIAARATALPEVVGDAALLVDPLETEAIAAAITRVARGDEPELAARGRERATSFTWEKVAQRVQAVIDRAS